MNNIPQLKTDVKTAFAANLDATTVQKLRDRFVALYQSEWNVLVASGTADTAANRANFAIGKVFDYIQSVYTAGSAREIAAAQAAPESIS